MNEDYKSYATKTTDIINADDEKPTLEWVGMDLKQIKKDDQKKNTIISPSREFFSEEKNVLKNTDLADYKSSRHLSDNYYKKNVINNNEINNDECSSNYSDSNDKESFVNKPA